MSAPSSSTRPVCGVIRRLMPRRSVDLPEPFGPTIAVSCPAGISRVSLDTTGLSPPYARVRFSTCMGSPSLLLTTDEIEQVRRSGRCCHYADRKLVRADSEYFESVARYQVGCCDEEGT